MCQVAMMIMMLRKRTKWYGIIMMGRNMVVISLMMPTNPSSEPR